MRINSIDCYFPSTLIDAALTDVVTTGVAVVAATIGVDVASGTGTRHVRCLLRWCLERGTMLVTTEDTVGRSMTVAELLLSRLLERCLDELSERLGNTVTILPLFSIECLLAWRLTLADLFRVESTVVFDESAMQ